MFSYKVGGSLSGKPTCLYPRAGELFPACLSFPKMGMDALFYENDWNLLKKKLTHEQMLQN